MSFSLVAFFFFGGGEGQLKYRPTKMKMSQSPIVRITPAGLQKTPWTLSGSLHTVNQKALR